MSSTWGTPTGVDMALSWPSKPAPKPNNSQGIPIPWGSDRPSAPSENNTGSKTAAQDSWGQGRSENSYISRNDVVQVDRFPDKPFPGKESTKLPDNVPPVNTRSPRSPRSPPAVNDDQRDGDDDQQLADIALQAVLQNSFESEKERREQQQSPIEEDYWDPTYHDRKSNLESDIPQSAKGRAEPSITSPNSTLSRKEFRDVEVQTDKINLTEIIASKEKLLSCMIDSPIMKDYQQNNVPEKRHSSQQPISPSLLDLGPDEWGGAESSWNKSSGKSDFRDNVISPTRPEINVREPDNDFRKPIQPPNNERNNNLGFDPQPTSVQANSRGPPSSSNPDWGTVSQQTPTQDNFYSQQPARDNQSNRDDRSQDVSSGNQDGQQTNKQDSWENVDQNNESDWMKKAEMIRKELGMSNETKDQRTEESYDTFNDNSSSNNRLDVSHNGNRYGNRDVSRDGNRYNRDVSRDGNRHGNRDSSRDYNRDGSRYGNRDDRDVSRDGNRSNRDNSRDGNRFGNRGVSRDSNRSNRSNRDGIRYGNRTDESSRDGYGGGKPCFKCGEEGHIARDCTKESSRGGYGSGKTCYKCNKEGHLARECPDEVCYKCNKPGHRANDCNEDAYETTGQDGNFGERPRDYNRPKLSPFSNPEPSNISSEDAWAKLLKADKDRDTDDFKEALELYAKATPKETFQTIERKLRDSDCNFRIVAVRREEIPLSSVLVDLQGNTNKKYVATPVLGNPSESLRRTAGDLPQGEKENYEWLADAGYMVDDSTPICYNCKQKGHLTRDCQEPKKEPEKPPHIGCQNCGSPGHMTKFCEEERRDYYAEARDRKAAGSRDRDPINDDKASSIYNGEEVKGFRGHASSSGQTCHNCHREGHISRDCPERQSGGGGGGLRCYKCNEEGHFSKDCKNSDRGNYNDYNQTAPMDTYGNDSRSKTGGDNTSQWNKSGGGDNTISRDDQNNYPQNREVRNDDSSVSTQDRTIQQKDITPYNTEKNTEKKNDVEPDTWESNTNVFQKVDWENKTHTFSDFNWETSNNKKESIPDKPNKGPDDYENKRGDPYSKSSDEYENRRGRGNDYSNNKGSDDYDNNRRGRGNSNSYNNTDDHDNRRGRVNNSSYNKGPDDYDNRRGRGTDDYDNNRRGRDNSSYNNNKGSDDYGRGRGNDSYNNNRSDDYGRGRNNSYNRSDDWRSRNNNNSYNNSDDYDNRRGRDNGSYNNKGSDDFGRGRGNDSYNNRSDDHGRGRNNNRDDYGRSRGNDSYNNRSDDYGRSRGNDSYNNRSDDYGRSRGNDSYNNRSDDYGRSRGNDSYNNRSDDYGRSRGGNSYNNDYGRSRGNDSYNKGSGDYGRNRGNDYNRGSDDYDRRDRRTQESREQNTQSNANTPTPNLDNVQTWW